MKCRHCEYEVGGYKPGFVRREPGPAMLGHLRVFHPLKYRAIKAAVRRSREESARDERSLLGLVPSRRPPRRSASSSATWWAARVGEVFEVAR